VTDHWEFQSIKIFKKPFISAVAIASAIAVWLGFTAGKQVKTCKDFSTYKEANIYYLQHNAWWLDLGGNGMACENLRRKHEQKSN